MNKPKRVLTWKDVSARSLQPVGRLLRSLDQILAKVKRPKRYAPPSRGMAKEKVPTPPQIFSVGDMVRVIAYHNYKASVSAVTMDKNFGQIVQVKFLEGETKFGTYFPYNLTKLYSGNDWMKEKI